MKILYITFVEPSLNSGGGIGLVTDIRAIEENSIDYIGPRIQNEDIKSFFENITELSQCRSKAWILFNFLIKNATSSFYPDWYTKAKSIDFKKYDVIYVERSCYSFVFDYIKNCKILLRIHNVEADYYYNIYKSSKKVADYIHSKTSFIQERKALNNASVVVCLTKEDKKRIADLYSIDNSKLKVIPHGYEMLPYAEKEQKAVFLATGSLWYGPNQDGICWLLDKVWGNVNHKCKLIIAGKSPNEQLKKKCAQYDNVILHDSPDDMEPLFNLANYYIAPIFSGAGIKIKTAEAILHRLPIIGTSHAFIGYSLERSKSTFIAEAPSDFINKINELADLKNDEYKAMSENLDCVYYDSCSMDRCRKLFADVMENL